MSARAYVCAYLRASLSEGRTRAQRRCHLQAAAVAAAGACVCLYVRARIQFHDRNAAAAAASSGRGGGTTPLAHVLYRCRHRALRDLYTCAQGS